MLDCTSCYYPVNVPIADTFLDRQWSDRRFEQDHEVNRRHGQGCDRFCRRQSTVCTESLGAERMMEAHGLVNMDKSNNNGLIYVIGGHASERSFSHLYNTHDMYN